MSDMKQCTRMINRSRCEQRFEVSDKRKMCQKCREKGIRHSITRRSTVAGKASEAVSQKKYKASDKGKARAARFLAGPKLAEWKASDKGRESAQRGAKKYRRSEKGKAAAKYYSLMRALCRSLCAMVRGKHPGPVSIPALGSFVSNHDARSYFQSTFKDWMNFSNHGRHQMGNAYNVRWNIGHRLPVRIFDATKKEDVRRCWNRENLYAQCARENIEHKDRLTYSDTWLLEHRHLWPISAQTIEDLKRLFRTIEQPEESDSGDISGVDYDSDSSDWVA